MERRRRVKVFSQVFFKKLAGCGTASHGLSRLRQTQEGVRERARWALSQGEPSSGVPPWKCAKAHFQKGCHQSLLKPAPSARRPLAEAAAVFQSWVPPRPLQRLPPPAYAPLALLFFHRLRRLRPWSSAPHLAAFEKAGKTFTCLHPAFAEGPALAERKKAACPVRSRTPSAGL